MTSAVLDRLREEKEEYAAEALAQGEDRPLAGYLVTMTLYGTLVAGGAAAAAARGARLPDRVSAWDFALMSMATHKLSRLITKETVTSPFRAPFTRFQGAAGPAELKEEVRATHGWRHSLGELVTCPFCMGMWVSTAFSFGHVLAPKPTRMAAVTLAGLGVSDFLQMAYAHAERKATGKST